MVNNDNSINGIDDSIGKKLNEQPEKQEMPKQETIETVDVVELSIEPFISISEANSKEYNLVLSIEIKDCAFSVGKIVILDWSNLERFPFTGTLMKKIRDYVNQMINEKSCKTEMKEPQCIIKGKLAKIYKWDAPKVKKKLEAKMHIARVKWGFEEEKVVESNNNAKVNKEPACKQDNNKLAPTDNEIPIPSNPSPVAEPHILDRAEQIMKNGDPVRYILDVHQTIHVGDKATATSLLVSIGCQSILNTQGIHAKLSGGSGKGKTHCSKAMAHLTPSEYKLVAQFSDKALFYNMNLRSGTVIFSDDVKLSDAFESVIKQATSNYQTITKYGTVIDREYVELTIPERLTFWLTSVNDDQSQQLLNRTFGGGVDETKEQDNKVWEFNIKNAEIGVFEYDVTDDVKVCREIIRQLKEQSFIVRIPFARSIKWNTEVDTNRRNMSIFLDMVMSFCVLRWKQRNKDGKYLDATIQDFDDALALYRSREENQGMKLTDNEVKVTRFIASKSIMGCITSDIVDGTGLSQSYVHKLIHGNRDREETGLLFKVKGLKYEQETQEIMKGRNKRVNRYYLINDAFDIYTPVIKLDEKVRSEQTHYTPIIDTKAPLKEPPKIESPLIDGFLGKKHPEGLCA